MEKKEAVCVRCGNCFEMTVL
uniref:Uncharacterized protein n=1 Tax=Anguilla anguilla TaxID=7936 RepID=A0A0E9V6E7_ANGAN